MKLWADEDVTPQLVDVANLRGYDAASNRSRGMLGVSDPALFELLVRDDWVLVTANGKDFVALAAAAELHPGLIVLPDLPRAEQKAWFDAALAYIEAQALDAGESPGDWMVCRIVSAAPLPDECRWAWVPEDLA